MRHAAKIDWWIVLAVLAGTLAPLPSHTYWATGMVLAILLVGGYPQYYETTPGGLLIRSGLFRRLVPYEAITFIGPATEGAASVALSRDRVKVAWGPASEILIAPARPNVLRRCSRAFPAPCGRMNQIRGQATQFPISGGKIKPSDLISSSI